MLNNKIQEIIKQANRQGQLNGEGLNLPQLAIVRMAGGEAYKVRRYANEEEAARREALLEYLSNDVPRPKLIGRVGYYLIFEYLELRPTVPDDSGETFIEMGKILGRLSQSNIPGTSSSDLDPLLMQRLNLLRKAGFLTPWAAKAVQRRYWELRPSEAQVSLGYWDLMPPNFGWSRGQLYLLDEKHLCINYSGIGLVKPNLVLPRKKWMAVLEGYKREASADFFEQNQEFLQICYYIMALEFYLRSISDGAMSIASNPRLRRYRQSLVEFGVERKSLQILEKVCFRLHFPLQNFRIYIFRHKNRRRNSSADSGMRSAELWQDH
jgi:hypothetical protein